ncbi:hypothetical protein BDAP_001668 [Binucleata daphniae]
MNEVEQFISIKNSDLHIAIYNNNEFRLVRKNIPEEDYEYFDKPKISHEKKYVIIKFGDNYMCNISNSDIPNICTDYRELNHRLMTVNMDNCTLILNHTGLCLTKGREISLQKNSELEQLNIKSINTMDRYDTLSFFDCNKSNEQCFVFENIDKESFKSVETRKSDVKIEQKEAIENEKYKKYENMQKKTNKNTPKKRKYEKPNDYDLKYNNKNLDDAHHYLANSDPDSILSRKHFAPDCFYGYNSLNLFLNDPLPNLRKLKQKYCFFNRKDIVNNKKYSSFDKDASWY